MYLIKFRSCVASLHETDPYDNVMTYALIEFSARPCGNASRANIAESKYIFILTVCRRFFFFLLISRSNQAMRGTKLSKHSPVPRRKRAKTYIRFAEINRNENVIIGLATEWRFRERPDIIFAAVVYFFFCIVLGTDA